MYRFSWRKELTGRSRWNIQNIQTYNVNVQHYYVNMQLVYINMKDTYGQIHLFQIIVKVEFLRY